jgi:hypothetical protein
MYVPSARDDVWWSAMMMLRYRRDLRKMTLNESDECVTACGHWGDLFENQFLTGSVAWGGTHLKTQCHYIDHTMSSHTNLLWAWEQSSHISSISPSLALFLICHHHVHSRRLQPIAVYILQVQNVFSYRQLWCRRSSLRRMHTALWESCHRLGLQGHSGSPRAYVQSTSSSRGA